jgi:hypothetical protein
MNTAAVPLLYQSLSIKGADPSWYDERRHEQFEFGNDR